MKEEAFDTPQVEPRIGIDTSVHYADHTEGIQKWLGGPPIKLTDRSYRRLNMWCPGRDSNPHSIAGSGF